MTELVYRTLQLLFSIPISLHLLSSTYVDKSISDDVISAAREFVMNSNQVRIDDYGNVHFIMLETIQIDENGHTSELVTKYEFFSRDDKYFRIDSTLIDSKNFVGRTDAGRKRFILGPDGFVVLATNTGNDNFALIDWGDVEEGLVLLFNYDWMQRAARSGRLPVDLILQELISKDSYLPYLYKRKVPDDSISSKDSLTKGLEWTSHTVEKLEDISFSRDFKTLDVEWNSRSLKEPVWNATSSMSCDVKKGVLLKYESVFLENRDRMLSKYIYEYAFNEFGRIPKVCEEFIENSGSNGESRTSRVKWKILDLERKPVVIGVFSLEAQGLAILPAQGVWLRRLYIILWALLLFGVVYLVHWIRHRVSE